MLSKKSSKGSVWAKLSLLLFHPTQFFESVKDEKDEWVSIKWAFGSFFVFGLLSAVLVWLFQNFFTSVIASLGVFSSFIGTQSDVNGLWIFVLLIIAQIALLPIFHWLVGKLGGKQPRHQTAKAIFYALVPYFLGGWIPFLGILSWFWSIYVEYAGLKVLQKFDLKKYILYVIGSLLIWVVLLAILAIPLIILVAIAVLLFSAITNSPPI